jgi:CheY-like chemotaxis protein
MSDSIQSQVFEPFFTTKAEGTGLGLATVYGIVKQNNGAVTIQSSPENGTTFEIYLPLVEEAVADQQHSAAESDRPAGGRETILVVEDNEAVRAIAERILVHLGYRVLVAAGAAAAHAAVNAEAGRIDLLLTDVVMPDTNGKVLADQLKQRVRGLRVVYSSGYDQDVIAHHGIIDDGVCFVGKPYTAAQLAATVRNVLDSERVS